MPSPTDDRDIRIVRIYDAPLAMVWDAWTDLDQVVQWWGPRGFTLTTHSKDLRPGGSWVYTMHGPDGTDWPNFTRYHEVVPQARLVYDHGASSADAAPMFHVTATFRDLGGRTELDMCMTLPTAEAAKQTRVFIRQAGGNGTWDRLAEHLEKAVSSKDVFVIARSFEAPLETVFDMWSTPEHLAAWLPPAGLTMTYQHADIRTGGSARMTMANDEFAMYIRHEFVSVRRPDHLSYRQMFTAADGSVARHPGAPTWPETTLVSVDFVSEGLAQTRVRVRFEVDGDVTPDELATFTNERGGMTLGWSASFDVLENLLAHGGMRGQ